MWWTATITFKTAAQAAEHHAVFANSRYRVSHVGETIAVWTDNLSAVISYTHSCYNEINKITIEPVRD